VGVRGIELLVREVSSAIVLVLGVSQTWGGIGDGDGASRMGGLGMRGVFVGEKDGQKENLEGSLR
jgi:hypothetical protein